MPTILIGAGTLRNQPGPFRDMLESAGFRCIDPPGDHMLTADELRTVLPQIDAILAGSEFLTSELMDLAPGLRVIARTGVGYDAIDVPAATARRIAVVITPGTNQGSVAEQTFALLLALTRDVVVNDRLIHAGGWSRKLPTPLRGRTIGLVGLGRIGRAVARRAQGFEMKVVAYDPVADPVFDQQYGIERVSLDAVLAESDVVSLHLPLTAETRGLVDRGFLGKMKRGSYLINTSRGGLVIEADLRDSLVSGHLAGAGLDVLNVEPVEPGNPLLGLPNVVLSPHLGGIDTKGMADMAELATQCVLALHQGKWPEGCVVNRELAEGWRW
ncbi:MAG: phosphoglycerate dehydrogenase [Isosphaeraceae bacterium]|nr:phosphoglycerate dehydrogenase [Isosphaeraceae bacterium]